MEYSFLAFLENKNINIDKIYIDRFYHSICNNKWILVCDKTLEWCGYKSESDKYKSQKKYLQLLNSNFNNNDYKLLTSGEFNSYNKDELNILFKQNDTHGNKKMYLLLRPRLFKESLMLMQTEKSKQIRKYYLDLEEYFNKYVEYTSGLEIAKLKEENERLKKNQSNIIVHYVTQYKPLENNTFIYVMATKSYMSKNLFKIGHTTDLKKRIKQHQSNRANGDEMYLIFSMKVFDSDVMEKFIFSKLEPFRQSKFELFHINFNMLMEIMKEFERMELENNNIINSIFSKYNPEDVKNLNLSEDIEIISEKANKEAGLSTENKYLPPVEKIRKINEAKHLDTDVINDKFRNVGLCLSKEYTGNCEEAQEWSCLSVLNHTFTASYSHAKWKYLEGNNKAGLVGRKGCPYCSKQNILEKVKYYSYKNKTWEFIESYESFEDLKKKEEEKGLLDTPDKVKIIKNIIREERWLTPVDDVVYSILSPDDKNMLNLNKVLTDYEKYIIDIIGINYTMMKQRIFKSKFNLIISIDEENKKAYVSDSMTQLSLKLSYVGCDGKKLNRKTIAKYVDSEKMYAGYIFRCCDNILAEEYKEKYEVVFL